MDLLRALSSPNEDVQRKTLDIAMGLVSPRNVEEVMSVLKKEIIRTQGADSKANKAYRFVGPACERACACAHVCAWVCGVGGGGTE